MLEGSILSLFLLLSCSFLPFFFFACSHRIRSIILPCKNFPPLHSQSSALTVLQSGVKPFFLIRRRGCYTPHGGCLSRQRTSTGLLFAACKLAQNSHYCKTQATGRPFVYAVLYRLTTGISLQGPLGFLEAGAQLVLNVCLAAVFSHRHSTPV